MSGMMEITAEIRLPNFCFVTIQKGEDKLSFDGFEDGVELEGADDTGINSGFGRFS